MPAASNASLHPPAKLAQLGGALVSLGLHEHARHSRGVVSGDEHDAQNILRVMSRGPVAYQLATMGVQE